jgi:2-methylisocitrate lyase-like PEP mutase family enzyme
MSGSAAARLRTLLAQPGIIVMPCCFDALSARLIERAGFGATFMSGFAVAAARAALPDTGLLSYGEMVDHGAAITAAVAIPVIGDGDTGYGNAMNAARTVRGYARAGFAGVMIEDQTWPKRCGHTAGKQVVERGEAVMRVRAAADAARALRDSGEGDIVLVGRTDAAATHGLDEAIARANAFVAAGADITFVEAPRSETEMRRLCAEVPGPKLANMLEQGATPVLPPARLQEIGYALAAYPLTLLSAAMRAMQQALATLREGRTPSELLLDFATLRALIGFPEYDAAAARYAEGEPPPR